MSHQFLSIFKQSQANSARGKFLSRIFGIFSEEIVRIWAKDDNSPYRDLGRPTLRQDDKGKGHTLDFTLENKQTGKKFVTELKCEIEYQNYRYFNLIEATQLGHHKKDAFDALLSVAENPRSYRTYVKKEEHTVDGAILIWGAATPEGRQVISQTFGFSDILTIAEMIADLNEWENADFRSLIKDRALWSNELFEGLLT